MVIILLVIIALFLFVVIGQLQNIKIELEKHTKQLDNNKELVDVIGELSKK